MPAVVLRIDGDGRGPIEVRIRRGTTTVTDHGPGIEAADTG